MIYLALITTIVMLNSAALAISSGLYKRSPIYDPHNSSNMDIRGKSLSKTAITHLNKPSSPGFFMIGTSDPLMIENADDPLQCEIHLDRVTQQNKYESPQIWLAEVQPVHPGTVFITLG